jgi:Outer membrane protein beta-barrel domain
MNSTKPDGCDLGGVRFDIRTFAVFALLGGLSCPALGQSLTNIVEVGGGGGFPISSSADYYSNAPAIIGRYELDFHKYLGAEIGIENVRPTFTYYCGDGCFNSIRGRVTLLPFGLRGVFPSHGGRLEFFAGAGGAYAWNAVNATSLPYPPPPGAWMFQVSGGARFALDHARHLWVGSTARYYNSLSSQSYNTQAWVSWTGEFGYRF